jgi:hypothetical protein
VPGLAYPFRTRDLSERRSNHGSDIKTTRARRANPGPALSKIWRDPDLDRLHASDNPGTIPGGRDRSHARRRQSSAQVALEIAERYPVGTQTSRSSATRTSVASARMDTVSIARAFSVHSASICSSSSAISSSSSPARPHALRFRAGGLPPLGRTPFTGKRRYTLTSRGGAPLESFWASISHVWGCGLTPERSVSSILGRCARC